MFFSNERSVEMTSPNIAICIPTFRRPQWLRRCLLSIGALATSSEVSVIVADNDAEKREGISVCRSIEQEGFRFHMSTVLVGERGISYARNALIEAAIRNPRTQLIAMIDDDEWAEIDWLESMIRTQHDTGADIIGGPVMRLFEKAVPGYLRAANMPKFDKMASGRIEFVDATSNILFKANLFRDRPGPWFDPKFALMGGEDKDLLLSFKVAGKTFAWASDAIVREELPASRCSVSWTLKRAFWVGSTDMLIMLKQRPPDFTFLSEAGKIIGATGVSLFNSIVFCWSPARRFAGLRLGARVIGKLSALVGLRHAEYSVTHGR
jgi:hypothetical protein